MDQIGSKWIKMDLNGSKWIRMIKSNQNDQNWIKMDHNGSKWIKWTLHDETGLKQSKWIRMD